MMRISTPPRFTKLLPVFCLILSCIFAASENFRFLDNSIMTSYVATSGEPVTHIEEDLYIPGNIIFSEGHMLKTLDSSGLASVVVGLAQPGYAEGNTSAAMFRSITSFVQLSASHNLVVDYGNHCVRSVNRLTNMTSRYIGRCDESRRDVDGADPKFCYPYGIIRDVMDSQRSLIITDRCNNALKRITHTRAASTIIKSNKLDFPYGLTQQHKSGDIFVMIRDRIVRYDYSRGTVTPLSTANGFSYPKEAIFLADNKLLVAETGNHQLKLINLDNNTTMNVCTGERAHADGNLTMCKMASPLGLAAVEEKLYIGSQNWIRVIQGEQKIKHSITLAEWAMIVGGILVIILIAVSSTVCIYRLLRKRVRNPDKDDIHHERPPINRHVPENELEPVYSVPDEHGIYVLTPRNAYSDEGVERHIHGAKPGENGIYVLDPECASNDDGAEIPIHDRGGGSEEQNKALWLSKIKSMLINMKRQH